MQVGSDLATAPRYYYSYNGHGDVVALTDAGGTTVATYSYDTFGTPTSIWESVANGWP
ncbi:MAG: RHS repeat domain-containing protein [Ktedonobacterales bacterium]